MTRRSFAGSLLLAVSPKREDLRGMEKRVFDAIDNQREHIGVARLIWSDELAAAARAQSVNMMDRDFFAHVDPVQGDLAARLSSAGIRWVRCGENLFTETGYIEPVWTAIVEWMHSPGHKQTLLDPAFTYSGVGIARNAEGRYWMTQIFIVPPPEAPDGDSGQRAMWRKKKKITRKAG